MKKIITTVSAIITIWYLQGCASNQSSVAVKDVKIENLNGAHYFKNKIWQDMPVNLSKKVSKSEAIRYCTNLVHLGTYGWTLPTQKDTNILSYTDYSHKLRYVANDYYHMEDVSCGAGISNDTAVGLLTNILTLPLTLPHVASSAMAAKNCQYKRTRHVFDLRESNHYAYVRCVLPKDKYMTARRKELVKASEYKSTQTYEGYLQAFRISKDLKDAKKAYALADTRAKKLQVEKYVVKNIAVDKLVHVTITGKGSSKVTSSRGDALKVISYAGAKKNISIKTRVSSNFLDYGKYRVTVEYTVKIPYKTTVKYFITATSKETRTGMKRETYTLSRNNHYRSTKTVSFNNIMVSTKMSMGSIEIMEGTTITAKVIAIEEIE